MDFPNRAATRVGAHVDGSLTVPDRTKVLKGSILASFTSIVSAQHLIEC